jgi:hypothetical protein
MLRLALIRDGFGDPASARHDSRLRVGDLCDGKPKRLSSNLVKLRNLRLYRYVENVRNLRNDVT